jgi:DNA-binding LacI/PurR family transcriptional regulator
VFAGGAAAADAVVAAGATAVVCHNDMLAIGVLQRLAARGVAVPGQVSVVGFDDVFGAAFCSPPLTTLAEHTVEAGQHSIEMLAQPGLVTPGVLERPPSRVLPTQLVVRSSSGPADGR